MAVTTDIARTFRGPRALMRERLAEGRREDRAVAFLIVGCLMVFVAQWPRLAREAELGGLELDRLIAYSFFAWLMVMPIVFYALAAVSHLLVRLVGGRGSHYGARLALFWTLVATAPLMLLQGLVAGFTGPGPQADVLGALWLAAFLGIWGLSLWEAEHPKQEAA